MANRETHIEDCMRLLGAEFNNVHDWLDEFAARYNPYVYLEYHRKFRHNKAGVEKCRELFGPLGEKAAKIHLIRDVDIYVVKGKLFSQVMGDEIEDLYLKSLQYFPSLNEDPTKYLEEINIGKIIND